VERLGGDVVDDAGREQVSDIRASAKEWHRLQLAALGFVGLCGVLKGDAGADLPLWLQSVSGILALTGLVFAAAAVMVVAAVAWPLTVMAGDAASGARRLRLGIGLTFVAVAVTSLSTMSSWWPAEADDVGSLEVTTTSGSTCGTVSASAAGWVDLEVSGDVVRIPLAEVVSIRPTGGC